jgi:hypothetical protein
MPRLKDLQKLRLRVGFSLRSTFDSACCNLLVLRKAHIREDLVLYQRSDCYLLIYIPDTGVAWKVWIDEETSEGNRQGDDSIHDVKPRIVTLVFRVLLSGK